MSGGYVFLFVYLTVLFHACYLLQTWVSLSDLPTFFWHTLNCTFKITSGKYCNQRLTWSMPVFFFSWLFFSLLPDNAKINNWSMILNLWGYKKLLEIYLSFSCYVNLKEHEPKTGEWSDFSKGCGVLPLNKGIVYQVCFKEGHFDLSVFVSSRILCEEGY